LFAHLEVKMWKIAVPALVGLAIGLSFADVLAGHISLGTITTGLLPNITSDQPAPSRRI
jgi:hypothetical protein